MIDFDDLESEELDVQPYEGEPEFNGALALDEDGFQDDEAGVMPRDIAGFVARVAPETRGWQAALLWYKTHNTASEIGFDPDGMCLKVCRTARNIPARYPSAVEAQRATPPSKRVERVKDLKRGMVVYYDDPRDENAFGHIATVIGRVRGFDPESLHDVLVITNSVIANELTVVRGDYFEQHWNDDFVFGATELNGVELDVPTPTTKIERFHDSGPIYDLKILARAAQDRPRAAELLDRIETQVRRLPDHPRYVRVRSFKEKHRRDRVLHMPMLDAAVADSRPLRVKQVRDEIYRLIESLPDV